MVAARAQELSDGCLGDTNPEMQRVWRGKVCRKVAKQPTMTLCYSATKFGMQGQIENAVRKLDEEGAPYLDAAVDRHKAAVYMAEIVWSALGDVVVAARTAMDWLKVVSQITAEAGMPVRWTSPIGLPVLQEYREQVGKDVKVHFGGQRVTLQVSVDTEKLSKRRQASGIAPNFVHALDASHLLATVNRCVENGLSSFAMIHDSYAVHAADTGVLNVILRATFEEQYTPSVLGAFRDEVIEQLNVSSPELALKVPPLPALGALDLTGVSKSEFFFA
jgi:DNA-directed RNA polymerase